MKAKLKAKFLQHLNQKKQDEGFTLIELLVVIIIIGILSAIALPSFLNQAAKARAAEAKSNVGAMNRSQQAYFLENQKFTETPSQLGLSIDESTDNFNYKAAANDELTKGVTNYGLSNKDDIKSYAGGVFYKVGSTTTILCETNEPTAFEGTEVPEPPTAAFAAVEDDTNTPDKDETAEATGDKCGEGTTQVK